MKLLITGAFKATSEQLKEIEKHGHDIVLMPNEQGALPCDACEIEGTICNGLFLYHNIEEFTKLKYIQLTSAGLDRVPLDYINSHSIEIHNARGVYSIPMAEFAICGVLEILKKSKFFYENQKECRWEKNRELQELYAKTVCIVGCGSVGTECAKRFKAFGCKVIGIDPYVKQNEYFDNLFQLESLDEILIYSDVVVLTLPLTEETKYLFDKERLQLIKKGAILVNIARGKLINQCDLVNCVSRFIGLVLDVFEDEPLDCDSQLWNKENVIVTPHNSFVGEYNNNRLFEVIISNLLLLEKLC